jgi:hypothetical protein
MKFVPRLRNIASNNWWGPTNDDNSDDAWEAASRELRALLAVARALSKCLGEGEEGETDWVAGLKEWKSLVNAHNRLVRLSKETP